MASASASEGQLVARPPIHPASFNTLNSNRCDEIFLYLEEERPDDFRYKLTVVDRCLTRSATSSSTMPSLTYATAVFLIPAGRESEYMFSSRKGLEAIAESAGAARLIAVTFGRKHVFESQEVVQQELTFVVQVISRGGEFLPSKSYANHIKNKTDVPFMALDGIGKRNVLVEGESALSGKYIVEQVQAEDGKQVRRLYFLDNPFVIQSEVVLMTDDSEAVDKSHAAFDYHKTVVAGIIGLSNSSSIDQGLMIGLGGGGLVNLLQHVLPSTKLTAVELDPVIVQVAEQYFGLGNDSNRLSVRIGDGLLVSTEDGGGAESTESSVLFFAEGSMSFVIIDVDSKNKTAGMSCPPDTFVEPTYLQKKVANLLGPDGLLAINVSARDPKMLNVVCRNVQNCFSTVFISKEDEKKEDLNVVVFACRADAQSPSGAQLTERFEKVAPQLDEIARADLQYSIEGLQIWSEEAARTGTTKGPRNGKRKKNRKRGKKR